jgi:hypothetical protein
MNCTNLSFVITCPEPVEGFCTTEEVFLAKLCVFFVFFASWRDKIFWQSRKGTVVVFNHLSGRRWNSWQHKREMFLFATLFLGETLCILRVLCVNNLRFCALAKKKFSQSHKRMQATLKFADYKKNLLCFNCGILI